MSGFKLERRNWKYFDHVLASSTQLYKRSFHVFDRTRTAVKCTKTKRACAKRTKAFFFMGEGKQRNKFAAWHVVWLAEWHNDAECNVFFRKLHSPKFTSLSYSAYITSCIVMPLSKLCHVPCIYLHQLLLIKHAKLRFCRPRHRSFLLRKLATVGWRV